MNRKYLYLLVPILIIAGCGKRLPTIVQQAANSVPRRVVMELFTATWCTNCPTSDAALERLAEEMGDSLTIIEYHPLTDTFGNAESEARGQFYGVDAWPTIWCDGLASQVGTTLDTYQSYFVLAHNRILLNSQVKIDLTARIEQGILGYSATIQPLVKTTLNDPRLLVLVLEDSIYYSALNGLKLHRFVCRDIVPDASGLSLNLVVGNTILKQGNILIDTLKWRTDRLWLAAIVQDNFSKEILQSDFVNLSEPVWDFTLSSGDTVITAGLDSTASYSFKIKNTGNQPDTFWLDLPDSLSLPGDLNRVIRGSSGVPLSLPYPLALDPGDSVASFTVELSSSTVGDFQTALTVQSTKQPTTIKSVNFYLKSVFIVIIDFSLTATDTLLSASVGATAEYPVTIKNIGNQSDTIWLDLPDSLVVPSSFYVAPALCNILGLCYSVPYKKYLAAGDSLTSLVVHLTPIVAGHCEASLTLTSKKDPLLVRRLRLHLEVAK